MLEIHVAFKNMKVGSTCTCIVGLNLNLRFTFLNLRIIERRPIKFNVLPKRDLAEQEKFPIHVNVH